VPEVALKTLAGIVDQADEGLPPLAAVLAHVAADLIIAALVVVLILQSPVDLGGRVPLLAGRLLVGLQGGLNDRLERAQLRRRRVLAACVRAGLRTDQGLANLPPGMAERRGDGPDAQSRGSPTCILSLAWRRGRPAEEYRRRYSCGTGRIQ
jgi:hypothetical protein